MVTTYPSNAIGELKLYIGDLCMDTAYPEDKEQMHVQCMLWRQKYKLDYGPGRRWYIQLSILSKPFKSYERKSKVDS